MRRESACQLACARDHGGAEEQDRPGVGCILVRRHLEPARGHRADHLPAIHPATGRAADAGREARQRVTGKPIENPIFPGRTSRPALEPVQERPTRRSCTGWSPTRCSRSCARWAATARRTPSHMKDARFTIPTPALLSRVVDMLDDIPMEDRDTNGDLYEYMLGKIASAGQKRPVPHPAAHHPAHGRDDGARPPRKTICDPACGTAGFLVSALGVRPARTPVGADRRQPAPAFPPRHVPRLRLRLAPCCASAA